LIDCDLPVLRMDRMWFSNGFLTNRVVTGTKPKPEQEALIQQPSAPFGGGGGEIKKFPSGD
jgi:hypothetical protein